ncbi:MAG: Rv0909 family putative TA system antitoxin [Stackebrandtia sp.]
MSDSDKFDRIKGKAEELKGKAAGKYEELKGRSKGDAKETKGRAEGSHAGSSGMDDKIDKAAGFINEKTGGRFEKTVEKTSEKIKDATHRK